MFPCPANPMDPLEDNNNCWDFLDHNFVEENTISADFLWSYQSPVTEIDFSAGTIACQERQGTRKSSRSDSFPSPGSKACRERLRRERINDRFSDLCSVLEPGRPAKTDKSAILDDAIRVLHQLKAEASELKEANEKLLEEIKVLKAEKNELREEKSTLKADKERIEVQLKSVLVPPAGIIPPHAAAYSAGMNKMAVYPSYGFVPMWQYMPPSVRDTSQDHELRPPAA